MEGPVSSIASEDDEGNSGGSSDVGRSTPSGAWVAFAIAGAALLFLGGLALGSSRTGGGFAANIGEAFRAAFGGVPRETVIPLDLAARETMLSPAAENGVLSQACEEIGDAAEGGEGPVFISEVAWMGSRDKSSDEWIELANVGVSTVDLSGWQLYDQGRKIALTFPDGTAIPAGGRMLLVREGASVDAHGAPVVTFRGALNNTNETLVLLDWDCEVVDAVEADPSWPAGDNASKRMMERDLTSGAWYTSAHSGGTPGLPNSPAPPPAVSTTSSVTVAHTTPLLTPPRVLVAASPNVSSAQASPAGTTPSITWCPQENLAAPTGAVLVNEVAWAGTGPGKTSSEWVELWNHSGAPVPLAGWQLLNRSRTLALPFSSSSILEPRGYLLIERGEDAVPWIQSDALFSGALKNNDEALRLFDRDCRLVDEVLAEVSWPAGTAAPDYRSAERSSDRSWHTFNWSSINGIFGTPRMVNSEPAPPPTALSGGGGSGASPGEEPAVAVSAISALISEVMAGSEGNASDEFVELYNPGDTATDLTGWCVKKRTSTGSESTLVASSRFEGISIAPRRYLLLANDAGYRGAITPDIRWPASYTLAYSSNAVVLYRGCTERADEAAWAEIPAGQSIARDGWDAATFSVQETPTPANAAGE